MNKGGCVPFICEKHSPPSTSKRFLLLRCKKTVELINQSIRIGSVNCASIGNALTAGCGASEAMHTDRKEELRRFAVVIQNVTNDGFLCYYHDIFTLSVKVLSAFSSAFILYPKIARLSITLGLFLRKKATNPLSRPRNCLTKSKNNDILYSGMVLPPFGWKGEDADESGFFGNCG
jgi:hypothetical protein